MLTLGYIILHKNNVLFPFSLFAFYSVLLVWARPLPFDTDILNMRAPKSSVWASLDFIINKFLAVLLTAVLEASVYSICRLLLRSAVAHQLTAADVL